MISTIECFNLDHAKLLLEYKDLFRGKIREELNENSDQYDPFKMLENYVRNSKKGKIAVQYEQLHNRGRYFAKHSCSLQSLAREIRGTIAADLYYDIDMVNCHPMIFKQLCDNADLSTTYLTSLCYNRERIFEELLKVDPSSSREAIKHGLLSLINGGNRFYANMVEKCKAVSYEWLTSFRNEVVKNIDALCKLNADLYEEMNVAAKRRPKSSTVNMLFCIVENQLLDVMIKYFRSVKIINEKNNYVNCFDGLMVEKKKCKSIEKLSEHIFKIEKLFTDAGYAIKLKIKPFDQIDLFLSEEDIKRVHETSEHEGANILNRFDYKDPYTFLDFHNSFSEKQFSSEYEMYESIEPLFPKVIAKVLTGDGIYIKKTSGGVDLTRKLGLSDFKMKYPSELGMVSVNFSNVLKRYTSFGEIVCKLNNESIADKSFNIWKGFQAERVDLAMLSDETKDGLDLLKTFIWEVWASKDDDHYKYIISWFSGLVSNLDGINRIALAMVSKEGCGKGTLTDFMKYILGNDSIAEVIGIQSITQKHNTIIQNKRLILVNEMSSTKDEFRSNFDKIKSLITDAHVQIEPKGIAPYKIDNIGNYILCTNHSDSIIIGESDRRYAVFEASDIHINDVPYFENLRKKCFNQAVANAFYTYLLDFDAVPLGVIPQTSIRKQLQELSLPTPLKFHQYVIEEEVYEENERVSGSILYQKYSSWCNNNGERAVSSTKFGTIIKSKWRKVRTNGIIYTITYD